MILQLAWRNLWRQRRRSLITATAMAVAVALCMAMIAFNDGTYSKLFDVMVNQQLGHAQVHHPAYPEGRRMYDTVKTAGATLKAIDALPETVAVSPKLSGYALIGAEAEASGGQLVGVVPSREIRVTRADERIVEGRFLTDDGAGEIVLGVGLAEEIEVSVDGTVVVVTQASDGSLGNALYTVVGLFKTGSTALDKSGSMMRLADLQELLVLDDQVHQITVLGENPDALLDLKNAVMTAVPAEAEVQTWEEASPQTAQLMAAQNVATAIVLGIVFAVASFGVLNTMMMSVFERTRELGVLMAIGMRPARLVAMVIAESFFLAALAGAIGLVMGGLLDAYLVVYGLDLSGSNPEGLSFAGVTLDPVLRGEVTVGPILLVLGSLLAVSVGASLFPAWRASKLVPVVALRADG